MNSPLKMIRQLFFWLAISIITLELFAITIGQWLPVEFRSWYLQNHFYPWMLITFPFAALITLADTLKKRFAKKKNALIIISTTIGSFIGFLIFTAACMTFGLKSWIDLSIVYRHKEDPERTINIQLLDIGAVGYKERRVVELKPFTPIFYFVREADTTQLNKEEREFVNEEGDIKTP